MSEFLAGLWGGLGDGLIILHDKCVGDGQDQKIIHSFQSGAGDRHLAVVGTRYVCGLGHVIEKVLLHLNLERHGGGMFGVIGILSALEDAGPIFVYTSFEKGVLESLAALLPDPSVRPMERATRRASARVELAL